MVRPVLLTSILARLVMPLGFSNIMMILCKSFLFPLNCLLVSNVVIVSLYLFVLPPPSPPLSLSLSLSLSFTHSFYTDPAQWSEANVFTFSQWASAEFHLPLNLQLFQGITGLQLCSFTEQQFQALAKESGHALYAFLEKLKASAHCELFIAVKYVSYYFSLSPSFSPSPPPLSLSLLSS